MATPVYQGAKQPGTDTGTGWMSRLGSMVGMRRRETTPSYDGAGQPTPSSGGFFAPRTPAYVTAPVVAPTVTAPTVIVESACDSFPIDPQALAEGQVVIVVPRRNGVPTQ